MKIFLTSKFAFPISAALALLAAFYLVLPNALLQSAFASAPHIAGISPSSGTTAGGTSVTITGTCMSGATVKVDGTSATVTGTTTTTVTFTTPAHSAGNNLTVQVSNTSDCFGSDTTSFTYVAPSPSPMASSSAQPSASAESVPLCKWQLTVGSSILPLTPSGGSVNGSTHQYNPDSSAALFQLSSGTSAQLHINIANNLAICSTYGPLSGSATLAVSIPNPSSTNTRSESTCTSNSDLNNVWHVSGTNGFCFSPLNTTTTGNSVSQSLVMTLTTNADSGCASPYGTLTTSQGLYQGSPALLSYNVWASPNNASGQSCTFNQEVAQYFPSGINTPGDHQTYIVTGPEITYTLLVQ